MTFVFVTPRSWAGKESWVKDRKKEKLWKHVRAYDASDLEQWLEQSIAGQVWFANETGQDAQGAISLDEAWKIWAADRSEEHTSELQSLMRISYAVFCLNKKTTATKHERNKHNMKPYTKIMMQ